MNITDWRKKIDELDRELVRLLNLRARCVAEIGKIKRRDGLPIQEPSREQEILSHVLEVNQGPLANEALQRVFQQIVAEGRFLQRRLVEKQSLKTKKE